MKLEFPRNIFEKYSTTKFHENPSSGNRVVPCGQKDGHGKANSRFRNSAQLPKNAVEDKKYNTQNLNNIGWPNLVLRMRFMLGVLTEIEGKGKKVLPITGY